jgi:hypothetical protein
MFWIPNGANPAGMFGSLKPPSVVTAGGAARGGGGVHLDCAGAEVGGKEQDEGGAAVDADPADVDADGETLVNGAQHGIGVYRIVDGEDRIVSGGEAPGPSGYRPVLGIEDERGHLARKRDQEPGGGTGGRVPNEAGRRRVPRATRPLPGCKAGRQGKGG